MKIETKGQLCPMCGGGNVRLTDIDPNGLVLEYICDDCIELSDDFCGDFQVIQKN